MIRAPGVGRFCGVISCDLPSHAETLKAQGHTILRVILEKVARDHIEDPRVPFCGCIIDAPLSDERPMTVCFPIQR